MPMTLYQAASLSADATTIQEFYSGPRSASGSGIVSMSAGTFTSLGPFGNLWIQTTSSGPSLLAVANAASGPAINEKAPVGIATPGLSIPPRPA